MATKETGAKPTHKPPRKAPAAKAGKAAPTKKPPGRPTAYTEAIAASICAAVAEGMSLRKVCAMEGMPALPTVFRWLADEQRAEFREQYARAREAQADLLAEQILEIADDGSNDSYTDDEGLTRIDHDVIARSRLRVDARKWLASKMAPKKYGDKLAVGGAEDLGPVQVTKQMTDAERAVRLSRLLSGSPDALAALLGAKKGDPA